MSDAAGRPLRHDSAEGHVAGTARYVDDLPDLPGTLHLAFGLASDGHARLTGLDLAAVRAAPGVVAVFTAADIPGENNVGPVFHDDKLFAEDEILYPGQPLFVVAATGNRAARIAARLAKVEAEPLPALVTIAQAEEEFEPPQIMARGDAQAALKGAPHRLSGMLEMGGQEHFYLEGQAALAVPGEGGQLHVISSTQHPSEVQHLIAALLGLRSADVTVEVRRMGGAFGGKETQAAAFAAACAPASNASSEPTGYAMASASTPIRSRSICRDVESSAACSSGPNFDRMVCVCVCDPMAMPPAAISRALSHVINNGSAASIGASIPQALSSSARKRPGSCTTLLLKTDATLRMTSSRRCPCSSKRTGSG
jgi:hypothetical protein